MCLVDHQDRVRTEVGFGEELAQQHAIRHVLDHRLLAGAIFEADRVANLKTMPRDQLGSGTLSKSVFRVRVYGEVVVIQLYRHKNRDRG